MRVARFIANRVAFNRQRTFSRFIIRLATAATMISVAITIITVSLANGFQQTVSEKVFSFVGHLRIEEKQPDKAIIAEETPIEKNDSLAALISKHRNVQQIHPFATKYVIVKAASEMDGVLMKGFDKSFDTTRLKNFIKEGRFIHFNDTTYSRELILSAYTAAELHLKLNDRVLIYFIRPGGEIRPDKLAIVGIYKTGIEEYDKTFAIGDLKMIQRKNDWLPGQIGGYEVFLHDYKQMNKTAEEIYNIPSFPVTWNTITAKNISPNIFDWLGMTDKTKLILIIIMVVVGVINLMTCIIILALERIRMIGILKSVGAGDPTVRNIFIRHAMIIALRGVVAGLVISLLLLWLQQQTHFVKLNEDAYYMNAAAVRIIWWQVAVICAGGMLICLLSLLIPSMIIKRIAPVKAIQFR